MADTSGGDELFKHFARRRAARMADPRYTMLGRPTWIEYPQATAAVAWIEGIIDRAIAGEAGKYCLLGESFSGKTRAVRRACAGRDRDVLVVDALACSDAEELLEAIYMALHGIDRAWMIYSELDLDSARYEVETGLRDRGVNLLVLDGFDPHASRFKDPFGLLFEELDTLSTRLGMSILLVAANAEIDSVVEGYAAHHLDPIPFGADFLAVLRAFERWACLHRPSNLHEEPTARYIHERTAGLIGRVDRLVSECARHAIDSGEECITIESMERCFKRDEYSW